MNQIPYFKSEEIEEIINNKKDLISYLKQNNVNENLFGDEEMNNEEDYEDQYEYEDEEMEDEKAMEENDVENMSDKEKVKLAYEILSMTSYEDEFFMSILSRIRKIMRS